LKGERERDPREKIIISMSCRGAIKAGEMLKYSEMESLVKRLHEIGEYTCPHGRPIIIRLGLDEIEKKFKRK
ncbi:MAG: DNA mismatch repair endonuclease MutL, partial [Fusobacteriaceae bacterium]